MMTPEMADNLAAAERISAVLAEENIEALVIGGMALAAHRYIRTTQNVDLGVNADKVQMNHLLHVLQTRGYSAVFLQPDGNDPLVGVIDIIGSFGIVQIVHFGDRFPAAIQDALASAELRTSPRGALRVIPIPQLVALKLYAGGWKSFADIVELLRRNPEADLQAIGDTCRKYALSGWEKDLDELREQ